VLGRLVRGLRIETPGSGALDNYSRRAAGNLSLLETVRIEGALRCKNLTDAPYFQPDKRELIFLKNVNDWNR